MKDRADDVDEGSEAAEDVDPDTLPPRTSCPPTEGMTDEDLEDIEIDYPDFDPRTSFVVSGPLIGTKDAAADNPRGVPRTRGGARRWVREHYGARFIREVQHPTRWAARVYRPGCCPQEAGR